MPTESSSTIAAALVEHDTVQVAYSVRDHSNKSTRTVSKTIFSPRGCTVPIVSSVIEQRDIVARVHSRSKLRFAVLREEGDGDSAKRWVEIWQKGRLFLSQEVTDLHGNFYTDDFYGALEFSPSENALVYVAEAKVPTSTDDDPYRSFQFIPELGEGLARCKRPITLYLTWAAMSPNDGVQSKPPVSLASLSHCTPTAMPILFGQATFISDSRIAVTGYEQCTDGRLLGIKGCYNRPAGIWLFTLPASAIPAVSTKCELDVMACAATKLTSNEFSCRSPRSNSSILYWLSCEVGGAHASCVSLHSADTTSPSLNANTLVDVVWEAKQGEFPGLYLDFSLSKQPFLELRSSDKFVVTHSTWGSRSVVLLISLCNGSMKNLTEDTDQKLFSWKVLCTDGKNRVVCVRSSPSVPAEVVLGTLDEDGAASWQVLDKPHIPTELAEELSKLKTSIISVPRRPSVEAIVVGCTANGLPNVPPPCILVPHGGPHAASTTWFSAAVTARALSGYTVSLPNYTGSVGLGQKHVKNLLGQCGSLDVEDCIESVKYLASIGLSSLGPGRQYIQGGSHGGFLTAHLIAQYPEVFTAAVLRNPVISCGEISTSDIPDWYYEEFGIPYVAATCITPEIYKKLYEASPISHVDNVKTPVLLLVGGSDMRVAPTQSLGYYHALKGRGRTVEMLCFPKESHPIDGVEAAMISYEAELAWFGKFKG